MINLPDMNKELHASNGSNPCINQLVIAKIPEERFEHWGFLVFSYKISLIISIGLVQFVSQN